MKISKFFIAVCALFLFTATAATAQNAKVMTKAAEKTAEFEKTLVAQDANAALSDEQKKAITNIYAEKLMTMRKIKKEGLAEEEMKTKKKAANKEYKAQINAVLTKEQKTAQKAARMAKKAAKG